MQDKFMQYLNEIGLRYAVTWAKYERVRLSTVQLWVDTCANGAIDTAKVAYIYNTAGDYSNDHKYLEPASSTQLPAILRKQAF
jgi:hypothetical protein